MENNFFVGQAEFKTGHVLKKDLSLFISGNDRSEIYEVFDSITNAIEYAKKMNSKYPEIEYWVENNSRKTIFYISQKEIKFYE
jgi:hypothetical protein